MVAQIGRFVLRLAILAYLLVGVYGLYLLEMILWRDWGIVGIVVGNLFFPFSAAIVPFYEGFANGDWTLALISYGWIAAVFLFGGVGAILGRLFT